MNCKLRGSMVEKPVLLECSSFVNGPEVWVHSARTGKGAYLAAGSVGVAVKPLTLEMLAFKGWT